MSASSRNASSRVYRGDQFTIAVPEDAKDHTIHSLEVPAAAGRSHRITIQAIPDVEASSPEAFAEAAIREAKRTLGDATRSISEPITLGEPFPEDAAKRNGQAGRDHRGRAEGPPAQRVVLRWRADGLDEQQVQFQLFLLEETTGLVVSASFSGALWETDGEQVEQVMRSLRPAS